MAMNTHPFRYTESFEAIKRDTEPGELVEHVNWAGGPSDFYFRDRSGHLHQIQFKLLLEDNS